VANSIPLRARRTAPADQVVVSGSVARKGDPSIHEDGSVSTLFCME